MGRRHERESHLPGSGRREEHLSMGGDVLPSFSKPSVPEGGSRKEE